MRGIVHRLRHGHKPIWVLPRYCWTMRGVYCRVCDPARYNKRRYCGWGDA